MSLYKDASLVMIPSAVKDGKLYSIRPTPEYGAELVTNGDFATDSNWTKGTGVTISGGSATSSTGGTYIVLNQSTPIAVGTIYQYSFNVTIVSGGIRLGDTSSVWSNTATSSGIYSGSVTAANGVIYFTSPSNDFVGSINSVSVKKVIVGNGDFTFSRGSNLAATRVDVNGLIEKGRENLLLQGSNISTQSGSWFANQSGSTTENSAVAPDGTTTASTITSAGTQYGGVNQVVPMSALRYTYSVYLKAVSGTPSVSLIQTDTLGLKRKDFVLTTSWQRYDFTFTSAAGNNSIYITSSQAVSWNAWGAQFELGLVATDYIETGASTAQAGILEDLPRLDYSGGASCPALLLEPLRTNICPNSEDVSNWNLAFATATPNDTISPEGVQNAAKIVTSSSGCDVKLTSIPVSPSTTYTASFYCKLTSGIGLQTRFYDNTNGANIEYYTYDSQIAVGEWKRVTRTFTTPAGCNNIQIWFLAASSSASVTAHYWGYQLEAGSYPTSYIPTYGSAVTRSGDSCAATSVSDLIGQEQGTIFIDANLTNVNDTNLRGLFEISDGTTSNRISVYRNTGGTQATLYSAFSGSATLGMQFNTAAKTKIAFNYSSLGVTLYVNGALVETDSNVSIPACNRIDIGVITQLASRSLGDSISQICLFKTALTNAELAALTTI